MPERNIDVRVRLKGADTFARGMHSVSQSMGWLDVTKGILGSRIIQRGFEELSRALGTSINESVKFETAAAALQKTANLSDTALDGMKRQIMAMSEVVPMTSTDIANLADTVAHLGMAKDQILPFSRVMIAMGEATDMSAEDAATSLAQMANVMGTATDEYERLGSTIFELGRTSATTESAIVEMAHNMAGSAALVGMSEADVLAFSAALSSVGVEAASGATTVQKLINRFEVMTASGSASLGKFAAVAGMTAEAFTEAWQADPAMAIAAFIDGLGRMGASGTSALGILKELGITEVRLSRNVTNLAAAGDLLDRSLRTGRQAWEDNTALAEATGIAYGTTASKMQMAQNKITNAQIKIGDGLKSVKLEIKEMQAEALTDLVNAFTDDSLGKAVEEINGRFDGTAAAIENGRAAAQLLVDKIQELGDPANLDVSGMVEYEAAMGALIEMAPDLGKIYDANTHSIEGGAEAMRKVIDEQAELAGSANELERSAELYEALSQRTAELTELKKQQIKAEADLTLARKAYNEYEATNPDVFDLNNSEQLKNLQEANKRYYELSKAVEAGEEQLQTYAYIADDAIAASDRLSEAMDAGSDAMGGQGDAAEELNRRLEAMASEAQAIMTDYEAALETAQKNLGKTFKTPFGGITPVKAQDPKKTLKDLDSQQKFAEEYAANLQKLKELGASDDVLAALSDGSEESAKIMKGLVADNGKSIDELNEKYASVQAAKDQMAAAMADASTQASEKMAEVQTAVDNMVAAADKSGSAQSAAAATVQGLIDGLSSKLPALKSKADEVAKAMAAASGGGGGGDGSHAAGLSYVPWDGYLAQLHRGEMVLTALEAKAYRAEQFGRYGFVPRIQQMSTDNSSRSVRTINQTINLGGVTTARESDVDRLARQLAHTLRRDQRMVGA